MPVHPPRDRRPRREEPRIDGKRVLGKVSDADAAYLLSEAGQTPASREGVRNLRRRRGIPAYRDT
jgi:hypothetical protein